MSIRIELKGAIAIWKGLGKKVKRVKDRIILSDGDEFYIVKSRDQEFVDKAEKIKFNSWEEFIKGTTNAERMKWCKEKAKTAKRHAEQVSIGISATVVWRILEEAKGICYHCHSLALEKKPSSEWEYMGRRIGSLDHINRLSDGGDNHMENLVWCCLLCNSHGRGRIRFNGEYINVRTPYHDSFGGYYPIR